MTNVLFAFVSIAAAQTTNLVSVESGAVVFDATTNVPGVEVKGKSTAVSGRVEVARDGAKVTLQRIAAFVPVKSLSTGMKVRDEHMRKYIFTTADGQEPDLRFTAEAAVCPVSVSEHEFTCRLSGNLSLRGVMRPLDITLRVKEQSTAFRANGDGLVKLSDYGIEAPTQFGVKTENEVKFHVELAGKLKPSGEGE